MADLSFFGTQWTVYEMFYYFLLYSTIGWFVEVVYMTLETGEFQNRGFLNGPICPIYGFGMVMIIIVLTPIQSPVLLYFVSAVICTTWELIVGIFMEKVFNNTWWDYSHERFNFKGYICLKVSLLWGLGCLIVMKIFHPMMEKVISYIPHDVGLVVGWAFFIYIIFDSVISLCAVIRLNEKLRQLDSIQRKLRAASETIGGTVSGEVIELKAKYDRLVEKKDVWQERLLTAFPELHSNKYNDILSEMKNKLKKIKK